MPRLSIIVPTLNEAAGIAAHLAQLSPLRTLGHEVIVADGGSHDGTVELARPLADGVIDAPRGRAAQMNAGAAAAHGEVLLFLHADTQLPDRADELILDGLAAGGQLTQTGPVLKTESALVWGRFDVAIQGRHPLLPVVAWFMNHRSRWTGIATGDQAMFVRREAFEAVGGFPDMALMEDITLSRRLKAISPPLCLTARVATSGRRWERHGMVYTILKMWRLRLAFFLGANPAQLAKLYGYEPRER